MVQAFETAALTARAPASGAAARAADWTAEDSAWATRVARESLAGDPAAASPTAALAERTRHALHRLQQRNKTVARTLATRAWRGPWLLVAVLLGLLCGVAVDAVGSGQRINLLAPPVWGVVLWNLLVYAWLAFSAVSAVSGGGAAPAGSEGLPTLRGFRGWWARRGLPTTSAADVQRGSPLARYAQLWAPHGTPLGLARAALLMHAAAAALALGLMGGLYARGLALEFRASWESTFLQADQVATVLRVGLAPASALTGIGVPDAAGIEALRVGAGSAAGPAISPTSSKPGGPAAPWIHLYAATLLLWVVLPRTLLALWAWVRAWRLAHRVALPLQSPYFVRLLQDLRVGSQAAQQLQVLPHGAAPSPQATLALQGWLLAAHGAGTQLQVAASTVYGQDVAAGLQPPPGTTGRVAVVDLATTPEADTHGQWLAALHAAAPALPLLLLADEASFQTRMGHLPGRLAERRAAWQALAAQHGAGFVSVNLLTPQIDGAADQLRLSQALQAPQAPQG
jgi:Protein of unknown function (DUF2868)